MHRRLWQAVSARLDEQRAVVSAGDDAPADQRRARSTWRFGRARPAPRAGAAARLYRQRRHLGRAWRRHSTMSAPPSRSMRWAMAPRCARRSGSLQHAVRRRRIRWPCSTSSASSASDCSATRWAGAWRCISRSRPARVSTLLILESASPGFRHAGRARGARRRRRAAGGLLERDGIAAFVDRWEQAPLFASQQNLPPAVRTAQRSAAPALAMPRGLATSLRGAGTGAQEPLHDQPGDAGGADLADRGRARHQVSCDRAADAASCCRVPSSLIVAGAGHAVHLEQPEEFDSNLFVNSSGDTHGIRRHGKASNPTPTSSTRRPKASPGSRSTARRCATPFGRRPCSS